MDLEKGLTLSSIAVQPALRDYVGYPRFCTMPTIPGDYGPMPHTVVHIYHPGSYSPPTMPEPLDKVSSTTSLSSPPPNEYSEDSYLQYRETVLKNLESGNTNYNVNMRRTVATNLEKANDQDYAEKRRKNNEAAKRSRDARKMKEDELAIRVSFLEAENFKLKLKLAELEVEKRRLIDSTIARQV